MAIDDRYQHRTDAELLHAARVDPEAFAAFYRRHANVLYAWFRRRAEADASELTAETFAQAIASLRRFKPGETGSAAPWLFGIAGNLLRRYYERHRVDTAARRKLAMSTSSYESDGDEAILAIDERERAKRLRVPLEESLRLLPDGQRSALQLRVGEGLPYAIVASRLNCSETAARIRVSRALAVLARRLR